MIFLIFFILVLVNGQVYSLDEVSEVSIHKDGFVKVSKSSNPTTGFSWFINPSSLEVVFTNDLDGDYIQDRSNLLGVGGIQVFTLFCSDLCRTRNQTSIILEYKQPWVNIPVDTVEVLVNIKS
ncbi:unnamed protein product [Blepharisma stoltei]|uniref:Proteinase inhibitor I42 chagasin domain-containing protein n=1 Tax=Blepharisma stoltei TaxID=1481888 RepID=A0AAU9JCX1_9CILI|nr:unnamed protein product [Blepharisma stoltei]